MATLHFQYILYSIPEDAPLDCYFSDHFTGGSSDTILCPDSIYRVRLLQLFDDQYWNSDRVRDKIARRL